MSCDHLPHYTHACMPDEEKIFFALRRFLLNFWARARMQMHTSLGSSPVSLIHIQLSAFDSAHSWVRSVGPPVRSLPHVAEALSRLRADQPVDQNKRPNCTTQHPEDATRCKRSKEDEGNGIRRYLKLNKDGSIAA